MLAIKEVYGVEFWQLGNTSVRSAMRIKDGLTAYSTSSIQGNIRRGDGDIAFRRLLGQCGAFCDWKTRVYLS